MKWRTTIGRAGGAPLRQAALSVGLLIALVLWSPTTMRVVRAADSCHLRELDICAASAAGANRVPVSDEDLDHYCALGTEGRQCVDDFLARCATPIQRELYSWATKEPFKQVDQLCRRNSPLRLDYLRYASCLSDAQPEVRRCIDDVHAAFERIERARFATRIPLACCTYRRYVTCAGSVVQERCGPEALQHGVNLLQKSSGATVDLLCQSFEPDSSQCTQLLPPAGTPASGSSRTLIGRLFSAYFQL